MEKEWAYVRKFDYSFLKNGLLPANLVNLTVGIASFKTMADVRKEEHIKGFTELEAIAKVQPVKVSMPLRALLPAIPVLRKL